MKTKRFISLFLAMVTVTCTLITSAGASTYIGSKQVSEGGFFGIGATKYNYKAYYDWSDIRYWYGLPLSFIPHHIKNTGEERLEISRSQSLTYSTTLSFNNSIGGKVGVEVIDLSASCGYGLSGGMSFTSTSVKSYVKTIPSSTKTGYYMIAPSQTEKKCHWDKYKVSDGKKVDSGTYYMPYGFSTVSCLYSADNSGWVIYSV